MTYFGGDNLSSISLLLQELKLRRFYTWWISWPLTLDERVIVVATSFHSWHGLTPSVSGNSSYVSEKLFEVLHASESIQLAEQLVV